MNRRLISILVACLALAVTPTWATPKKKRPKKKHHQQIVHKKTKGEDYNKIMLGVDPASPNGSQSAPQSTF